MHANSKRWTSTFRSPLTFCGSRISSGWLQDWHSHLLPSIATALCHQDQEVKYLHSTKPLTLEVTINLPDTNLVPIAEPCTNIKCIISTESWCSYSDQTSKFPVKPTRVYRYICVLYHYDTKLVHAVEILNHQVAPIRKAWQLCFPYFIQSSTIF